MRRSARRDVIVERVEETAATRREERCKLGYTTALLK
jgi:hypothetical protein